MNASTEDGASGNDADLYETYEPYEPSEEEIAQMRSATPAEHQAADAMILGECSCRWQKVAKIVGNLFEKFDQSYPHLPLAYLQARMQKLEDLGQVEIVGDVWAMRFSEIRLVNAESKTT